MRQSNVRRCAFAEAVYSNESFSCLFSFSLVIEGARLWLRSLATSLQPLSRPVVLGCTSFTSFVRSHFKRPPSNCFLELLHWLSSGDVTAGKVAVLIRVTPLRLPSYGSSLRQCIHLHTVFTQLPIDGSHWKTVKETVNCRWSGRSWPNGHRPIWTEEHFIREHHEPLPFNMLTYLQAQIYSFTFCKLFSVNTFSWADTHSGHEDGRKEIIFDAGKEGQLWLDGFTWVQ